MSGRALCGVNSEFASLSDAKSESVSRGVIEKPPSLVRTWPVTQAPSSVASQPTRRAASSGLPQRPSGSRRISWRVSSGVAQPVSVGPGLIALTRIPRGARWAASDAVIA